MPKTVTPRTRAEELRHVAGLATRKYDDAYAAWEAFADEVEVVRHAAEAFDSTDLSEMNGLLGTLFDGLAALAEAGGQVDGLDTLQEAYEQLQAAEGSLGVNSDSLSGFAEAYDELESALDQYNDVRESDRYEGRRDDLESNWEEVTSKMEALADLADELGFDFTPAATPEAKVAEPGLVARPDKPRRPLTQTEFKLLEQISKSGTLAVAGVVESRAVLEFMDRGMVEVVDGEFTENGGSGHVKFVEVRS